MEPYETTRTKRKDSKAAHNTYILYRLALNAEGAAAAICKLFDMDCCISAG